MNKSSLEMVAELREVLSSYTMHYPSKAEVNFNSKDLSFSHFLSSTSFENLYNRNNFQGHITASAFILDASGKKLLLLHHKSLNRWLQPGGHVDVTDESILDAAIREVVEETGIPRGNLNLVKTSVLSNIPFDIDSHRIPANPKKSEDAHVHHDLRYLLKVKNYADVEISSDESNGFRWVRVEELRSNTDHARVAEKILKLKF